ncbi:hypothetical protein JJQ72_05970 [Paenibacillus sp. F411]|uniref:Uncharacterized protein n=1 Tax=Paenibacillus algicola TaxID=2565926 RepID=A0A4P8XM62_9BACL|nr:MULTISPECIES: hypothetical protein [Paenibacillus]MBO2943525.1 hypothetical protein [Paenibacillus sp. F411]QCT03872.1 hypothetical protein E6C60_3161 [Paenibacillus algicola]
MIRRSLLVSSGLALELGSTTQLQRGKSAGSPEEIAAWFPLSEAVLSSEQIHVFVGAFLT